MGPAGFSQIQRLTSSTAISLCSARSTHGASVLLERVEGGASLGDSSVSGDSPLERAVRGRVERQLDAIGLCSPVESSDGKWLAYPNPAHCTHLLTQTRPRDLRTLTDLALSVLGSLGKLHDAGLLFCRALHPHVLWNPDTGKAVLVGLYRSLPRRLAGFFDMRHLQAWCAEGWRSHRMAPDERADILLCGTMLAKLIRDDRRLATAPFSRVVEAMTAVEPEDRYQSLGSAIVDVRRAGEDLMPASPRHSFLATYYASGRLYGREEQAGALGAALRKVRNGTGSETELIIVSGESGSGKSALCLDLIRRNTDDRMVTLVGKFHSAQRASPLSAVTEAMTDLVEGGLQDGERRRDFVTRCLMSISASSRSAIAAAIPSLHLLLDEPALHSAGEGAPRKISTAFAELVWTMSSTSPVCLFLDDCQWADHATLELVRLMMSRKASRLLIVMAMRNRARAAAAYLDAMVDDLLSRSVKTTRLELGPLEPEWFASLLSDSTGIEREAVEPYVEVDASRLLPAVLYHGAQLKSVRRAVQLLPGANGFRVSSSIRIAGGEASLREGFRLRFEALKPSSRRIVEIASTLGTRFELSVLIAVTGETADSIAEALLDAVEGRLIRPISDFDSLRGEFRFEHDIAQEAVYRSMPRGKRDETHEMIAFRLEQSEDYLGSSLVFDVADHAHRLWESKAHATDGRTALGTALYFRRQCKAGNTAYRAGVFAAAAEYFRRACQVAGNEGHPLSRPLFQCIESLIAVGKLDRAAELLESVDRAAADRLAYARLQELGLRLELKRAEERSLEERKQYARRYNDVRVLLRRYAVRLPRAESPLRFILGLIKAIMAARVMSVPSEVRPASELSIVLGRLLSHAATLAYIESADLSLRVHLTMVRFMRRRSAPAAAPYSFALLGALLAVALGRQEAARRLARVAERLLDDPQNADVKGRTLFHIYGSIMPMLHPYRESNVPLREAYLSCIEARENTFAGLCSFTRLLHRFFAGDSLAELVGDLELTSNVVASGRGSESIMALHQAAVNLVDGIDEPWAFRGPMYDERVAKGANQPRTGPAIVSGLVALACGRYEVARARAQLDALERNSIAAVPMTIMHDFLMCFCGFVLEGRLESSLARSWRRLANAAHHCRANFAHLYLLVCGERERSRGRLDAARNFYQRAAERAEQESCQYACVIAFSRLSALASERGYANIAAVFGSMRDSTMKRWRGAPPHGLPSRHGNVADVGAEQIDEERNNGVRQLQGGSTAGGPVLSHLSGGGEPYARSYLSGVDIDEAVSALTRSMESDQLFTESGLRVGELAAHVGLTAHQLAELFSRHLDTSFARYVNAYRVGYAAEQIRLHRDLNLLNIAFRSGFSSKAAFNVAFKLGTGLTPTQYRHRADASPNGAPPP